MAKFVLRPQFQIGDCPEPIMTWSFHPLLISNPVRKAWKVERMSLILVHLQSMKRENLNFFEDSLRDGREIRLKAEPTTAAEYYWESLVHLKEICRRSECVNSCSNYMSRCTTFMQYSHRFCFNHEKAQFLWVIDERTMGRFSWHFGEILLHCWF